MKNNNKELLKKHHFWILFGLVPLFVLIAVLVISSSVGGAIEKKAAEIAKAESEIKAKSNPKSNLLLEKMGDTIKTVDSKQDGLWKGGYTPQKSLYTMLDSPLLRPIERLGLKFGDKIPNNQNEYEEFKKREYYRARYVRMAESVSPTAFANGWESILRHVNQWSPVKLTSEQIWLLMEDIWVQESLLEAISSVNAQMAEFTRVKYERDGQVLDDPTDKAHQDPLRRKFRSRTWEIELDVVPDGNKRVLKGRLTNITDKLQLMGNRNTMILNVWLSPGDKKLVQPFEFKIGGEFLPGEGATKLVKDKGGERMVPANVKEIEPSPDHAIPLGMEVSEIVRVEQVFDSRTVPIRMIENLALGFPDSRNKDLPLKPPVGKNFEDAPPPGAEGAGGASGPASVGGAGSMSGPPGGAGSMSGPPGPGKLGGGGMAGSGTQTAGQLFGGGTVASVLDGNKKRYIDSTEQVRRMPIGIVVIVDQAYLQDVQLALANSPLRFQITQVLWNRCRKPIDAGSDSGAPGSPSGGGSAPGGIVLGGGSSQFGSEFGPNGGGSKMRPSAPGPGSGILPGLPGGGMGGGAAATVSEAQLTSGLIELEVYGIVSLYYNPEAAAAEADKKDKGTVPSKDGVPTPKDGVPTPKDAVPTPKDAVPTTKDAAPKDPMSKDPASKDPATKDPMTTDPKAPKM